MSYFKSLADIKGVVDKIFTFGPIVTGTINQIACADGSIAGWKIVELLNTDNSITYAIQVYDSSTGENIALTLLFAVPGADLLAGLFVTGCIPDRDVLDPACVFYRVDYT